MIGKAAASAPVYGCAGFPNTASLGPSSTIRPAYMTAMRWHTYEGVQMVVGDEDERKVELALQPLEELEHLRLHHDVERRRRFVRSGSADHTRVRARWTRHR